MLTGPVLIGREEVKPVIWSPGYMTISGVVEVGIIRLICARTCRPKARRKQSYSYGSQDKDFQSVNLLHSCSRPAPESHGVPAPHPSQ